VAKGFLTNGINVGSTKCREGHGCFEFCIRITDVINIRLILDSSGPVELLNNEPDVLV
jgi:hypothetical protein